jgi:hypothetical protein
MPDYLRLSVGWHQRHYLKLSRVATVSRRFQERIASMDFRTLLTKARRRDVLRAFTGFGFGVILVVAALALLVLAKETTPPAVLGGGLMGGMLLIFLFAFTGSASTLRALEKFYKSHGVAFLGFFELGKQAPGQELLRTAYTLEDGRAGIATVFLDEVGEPQIGFAPAEELELVTAS